jgi:hypothetical protein
MQSNGPKHELAKKYSNWSKISVSDFILSIKILLSYKHLFPIK